MSLCRPLELDKALTVPERGLNVGAIFDVLLIALFLSLLGSRFVFAPGLTVDLGLDLPQTAQENLKGLPTDAVLTVKVLTTKRDNMHIFNGTIYTMPHLEQMFREYQKSNPDARQTILLLKMDKSVTIETQVRIFDLARLAGFAYVQLAVVEDGNGTLGAPNELTAP